MSSRKFIEERRQKKQRQNNILVIIMALGAVLVIGAFVLAFVTTNRVNLSARQIITPEFTQVEQDGLNGLGNPDAPIVIEEFSDFGCTHCADFALETKKLIEEEYVKTGQVYFVFHSVGGLLNAPATFQAAEAAYCAGDQDALWQFHDLLFANQGKLFLNGIGDLSKTMTTFAEMLDLDTNQFDACLAEGKYQTLTANDQALATENGITGTPSFLINGVLLKGNQPFENFQTAIADALLEIAE